MSQRREHLRAAPYRQALADATPHRRRRLGLRNIVNIAGEDTYTHIRMHALTYTYIRTHPLSLHAYTHTQHTLAYILTRAYAPTLPLLSLFYLL